MTTTANRPVLPGDGLVFRKDVYFEQTEYYPHRGQREVHYDNTRHRALSNGRRWGKTLLGGKEAEACGFVKNFLGDPLRGWIIGPEYSDCEKEFRVVYNTFKRLGIDAISTRFVNNKDSGSMQISTAWGFDVQCRSAKHPDSLVGEGLDFVLMVEAGRLHRRTFTEYVRPALSDKRGWSLMTGVPEIASDNSLLYWGYERGQDPMKAPWASWRKPSWNNTIVFPGGRQDPEILEAEDDLTEDEFRRQYGGEFVERIGRVMKEWDDDTHLVEGLNYDPTMPLYVALDYGYTNDWVWLWIQEDIWGQVYVLGEWRWIGMDSEEVCQDILSMRANGVDLWPLLEKVNCIYAPPAEPSDTSIVQRKLGRPMRTNTGGEINDRDRMTNNLLKPKGIEHRPGLLFDKGRCNRYTGNGQPGTPNSLAWEMRTGYRWPENKSETKNASENPLDKDNHGPEALGRFVKGHLGKTSERRSSRQSRIRSGRR
jgi:hypothetical protein